MQSYRDLEVWRLAREVSVDIHTMTLEPLPKFELYEQGGRIRRSSKSIRSDIVEGFGRRLYKQEFIRFLSFAPASCDEALEHLDTLYETGSPKDQKLYQNLAGKLDKLGRKLSRFIAGVEREPISPR